MNKIFFLIFLTSFCISQTLDINRFVQALLTSNIYKPDETILNTATKNTNRIQSNEFNCTISNTRAAVSVHQLRPSDIRVIAALGDSLTAAVGANAKTPLGLLIENREVSWSIGGKETLKRVITLPNIIKRFNSKLVGFSLKSSFLLTSRKGVGFNAAVSGQEARHALNQAKTLIQRFKESKLIDFNNDWKLITILIGDNDLCDYCFDKDMHSAESFISFTREALDLFHKELPKTFINLVNVLNVAEVKYLNFRKFCNFLQKAECPCVVNNESNETRKEMQDLFNLYTNYTEQLVSSGRYDTRDDFTVVYQPFLRDFKIPKSSTGEIDSNYFAPDCFHFSSRSHALVAVGLWNNMLQPVGNKYTSFSLNQKIKCSTDENPYFFTNKNSI